MRHTLPGDNYTILSLQWNEGVDCLVSDNYTNLSLQWNEGAKDFNTSHFVTLLFSEL